MPSRFPSSLTLAVLAAALLSCALPRTAASQALRAQVGAYELEVLVDGVPARTYAHGGESYVLGEQGSRYVLRVHNRSGRRIEAVVAVDGIDVIDGQSADFASKRGYLVPAYGHADIAGWRLSEREAAAFRFAAVDQSYAAKSERARDVGVIGVAVFPERVVRPAAPVYAPEPSSGAPARPELGASRRGRSADFEAKSGAAPAEAPAAAPADSARAEGTSASAAPARRSRPGLGTEFGEAVSSHIRQVAFVRAHAARPSVLLGARYNDRSGLYALGIDVDGFPDPADLALRQTARPFPVSQREYARPPLDWRRD